MLALRDTSVLIAVDVSELEGELAISAASIAATAHAHDARLSTLNTEDLVGIDQLVDVAAV